MIAVGRILTMAEMHGRDLLRRHIALALLVALPLSFYLASSVSGSGGVSSGGIGMAFAVSGATLFSSFSCAEVDRRLVLGGYRPIELLLGRLLFLGPSGLVVAGGFAALMAAISHPANPWLLGLGVAAVAVQSVPFGLAVAAVAPRELEGVLVLIGVIGIQLSVSASSALSKTLPFYGPRRLINAAANGHGSIAGPLLQTAAYGVTLLVAARLFTRRLPVRPPR